MADFPTTEVSFMDPGLSDPFQTQRRFLTFQSTDSIQILHSPNMVYLGEMCTTDKETLFYDFLQSIKDLQYSVYLGELSVGLEIPFQFTDFQSGNIKDTLQGYSQTTDFKRKIPFQLVEFQSGNIKDLQSVVLDYDMPVEIHDNEVPGDEYSSISSQSSTCKRSPANVSDI